MMQFTSGKNNLKLRNNNLIYITNRKFCEEKKIEKKTQRSDVDNQDDLIEINFPNALKQIPKHYTLSKKRIGAHVATYGGVFNAIKEARAVGATSIAFHPQNPKNRRAKPLHSYSIHRFKELIQQNDAIERPNPIPLEQPFVSSPKQKNNEDFVYTSDLLLPHGSYLMNLGSPDEHRRDASVQLLMSEMKRCRQLNITKLNIHPGSSRGEISADDCIELIAESINYAIQQVLGITIVLENVTGSGHLVGRSFDELRSICDLIDDKSRIGVCLDTCHMFAAGYDIRTASGFNQVMNEFDQVVGFDKLKGVHLNDCKSNFGSNIDRHDNIGRGKIGIEPFKCIMNDDRFNYIPMVLETPNDIFAQEIELLYSFEEL